MTTGRPYTYPWPTMRVGAKFKSKTLSLRSARTMAWRMGRDHNRVFKCRQVAGGVEVRRVR